MAATTPAVVDRGGTRSDIRRQSSGLGFGAEGLGCFALKIGLITSLRRGADVGHYKFIGLDLTAH